MTATTVKRPIALHDPQRLGPLKAAILVALERKRLAEKVAS